MQNAMKEGVVVLKRAIEQVRVPPARNGVYPWIATVTQGQTDSSEGARVAIEQVTQNMTAPTANSSGADEAATTTDTQWNTGAEHRCGAHD